MRDSLSTLNGASSAGGSHGGLLAPLRAREPHATTATPDGTPREGRTTEAATTVRPTGHAR